MHHTVEANRIRPVNQHQLFRRKRQCKWNNEEKLPEMQASY